MEVVLVVLGVSVVVGLIAFLWHRAKKQDEKIRAGLNEPVDSYAMSQKVDRDDRDQ